MSRNSSNEAQLDNFKIRLGLPPDLAAQIVDPMLTQFDLINPALTVMRDRVIDFRTYLSDPDKAATIDSAVFYRETALALRQQTDPNFELVHRDVARLQAVLPARRQELQRLSTREEVQNEGIDPRICSVAELDKRFTDMNVDLADVTQKISGLLDQIEVFPFETLVALAQSGLPPNELEEAMQDKKSPHTALGTLVDELSTQLMELQLVQARARLDAIMLTPVRLSAEEALAIARDNRRDWMNARADLVDSPRRLQYHQPSRVDLRAAFGDPRLHDLPRGQGPARR